MNMQVWLGFGASTFLICLTPGPNMLLMLTLGLRHGLRATLPAMLGALLVLLAMLAASALGLGLLLQQSPQAFLVLKALGAAYLAFLGVQLLRAAARPSGATPPTAGAAWQASPLPFAQALGRGMTVAASNPKAIMFAAAWFPQFIDPARSAWPQLAVALPTFLLLETCCYFLYASGGEGLARRLREPRAARRLTTAVGVLFLIFAALLLRG